MSDPTTRADQIDRFRQAFKDASDVGIEDTGGGCQWLAFRWDGDPVYYIATNGEASLPTTATTSDTSDDPLVPGGWGVVARYDDTNGSPDWDGTPILQANPEGEPVAEGVWGPTSNRYWDEYPAHCLSDEQVVQAIRDDRARRGLDVAGAPVGFSTDERNVIDTLIGWALDQEHDSPGYLAEVFEITMSEGELEALRARLFEVLS